MPHPEDNGIHGQKRMWGIKKMDELKALAATVQRLMSPER
jgi:hypothetical protein